MNQAFLQTTRTPFLRKIRAVRTVAGVERGPPMPRTFDSAQEQLQMIEDLLQAWDAFIKALESNAAMDVTTHPDPEWLGIPKGAQVNSIDI